MKKLLFFVVMTFVLLGIKPGLKEAAETEPQVKVELQKYLANQTSISLRVSGSYFINETNTPLSTDKTYTVKTGTVEGIPVIRIFDGDTVLASRPSLSIITINRSDYATFNTKGYLGNFTLSVVDGHIKIVNTIFLEDYVKCVVPSEMWPNWHIEAYKAQAVASRSYGYFHRSGVIDTAEDQAYEGITKLSTITTEATKETAGEMVTYDGRVIEGIFSASNGGMTENNHNEFNSDPLPYFPIQKDESDTTYVWSPVIKKQQIDTEGLDLSHPEIWWDSTKEANPDIAANIKSVLNNYGYDSKDIKIVSIPKIAFCNEKGDCKKTESGRYVYGDIVVNFFVKDKLDAQGKLQLKTIEKIGIADNVRDLIGRLVIKSTLISKVTETDDSFTISGAGFGHGVGMSQYGANERANDGTLYKDILSFYYPGTTVTKKFEQNDTQQIKIQLNGQNFTSGYYNNETTFIYWKALQSFNIPYTYKGNGLFEIGGSSVQGVTINGGLFLDWADIAPGQIQAVKISGGYNFIYAGTVPTKIQLNGVNFKQGYTKNGTTYVHYSVLGTFKIHYTYKGNGLFDIEGRAVKAELINGGWYIAAGDISPGKIQMQKITGGYNIIYYTPVKVQLNGQNFKDGYLKNGTTYVNWTGLRTLNIPYTYKGSGVYIIEGRTVQAAAINGSFYIHWYSLAPGKMTYTRINGGYNFIYKP